MYCTNNANKVTLFPFQAKDWIFQKQILYFRLKFFIMAPFIDLKNEVVGYGGSILHMDVRPEIIVYSTIIHDYFNFGFNCWKTAISLSFHNFS